MRKLLIILATILTLLVLMVGGIWGYLWHATKQQVAEIVAAAKPFAEITHGQVFVSPLGSASVRDIKIIPNTINDVIPIGAISLNTPNLFALFNLRSGLKRGEIPQAMSLSIENLELPLHGGMIGAKPPPPSERTAFDDLDALGCGPVTRFSGNEWEEMGYTNFLSNLEIGYQLNSNNIQINLSSNTENWASIKLDISFALPTPVTSMATLGAAFNPKLASLNLVIRDDGYNKKRSSYCAAKIGKSIRDYVTEHVRLVVEQLRMSGIQLGPGLIAAYRDYLNEQGSISLSANPPMPINPAELPAYRMEDVVKMTGLTLEVNDQRVTDLSADWDAKRVMNVLGLDGQPAAAVQKEKSTSTTPEPAPLKSEPAVVIQQTFHDVAVDTLPKHLGKIAKLKTRTGASYLGKLETFADGAIGITIRKKSGTATLSLRMDEITQAEVLY